MRTKSRMLALACALLALCVAPAAPRAQDGGQEEKDESRVVTVRVVEVAGGRAYIEPGEEAGLRAGQNVRFRKRRFRIAGVTRANAVIELGDTRLRTGDRGRARVVLREAAQGLEPPPPLSVYRNQWGEATRPASRQNPKAVPLGGPMGAPGRYRLVVQGGVVSFLPLGDDPVRPQNPQANSLTRLSLGARLQAQPWRETPFGFDADVAVSKWLGNGLSRGLGADSRPLVRVRELRLRYGDAREPMAGLGRLRYAASTVGLLDGVRVQTPFYGKWRVAGFGGFVPDLLSGRPAFDAARFGVETTYHDAESAWRTLVNVVAQGSLFDGRLDERRLSSYVRMFRGPLAMMAHGELSMFDDDNPWGASPVQLSAAGVNASVRMGPMRASARFDVRTPERSYWLASLLPQSWLCTSTPLPPPNPADPNPTVEPCNGNSDMRRMGAVDIGYERGRMAVTAGAATVGVSSGEDFETVSVFADARALEVLGRGRVELGVLGSRGAFLDTVATRVGGGAAVGHGVDVSLYYRPALLRYQASVDDIYEHRFGADVLYTPRPVLDLALTLEGVAGADAPAVGMFATAVWRPLL